jgi:hypothetical protein
MSITDAFDLCVDRSGLLPSIKEFPLMHRLIPVAVSLLMLGSVACGSGSDADDEPTRGPSAACLAGDPDCYETGADSDPGSAPTSDPAGSACLVGDPDCYETGAEADDDALPDDSFSVDGARQAAHGLLGLSEDQLPDDVRIARRGLEEIALTADYVVGRLTVDLDDTDGSGYRVVDVTIELPDGPETFELTPG